MSQRAVKGQSRSPWRCLGLALMWSVWLAAQPSTQAVAQLAPPHQQFPAPSKVAPPPSRIQIAGTRVTLIPAPGFKTPPGATMLAGRDDGMFVLIQPLEAGKFEAVIASLASPKVQEFQHLADVKITRRIEGNLKRAFITLTATEAAGVTRRHVLIIDDGKSAASIAASVTRASYDASPELAQVMDAMLQSVQMTDKVLAPQYAFTMTPPPGFAAMGASSGQMQMFGHGEQEIVMAIRLEKPANPAVLTDVAAMGKAIFPRMLATKMDGAETTSEKRGRSGEWDYYEETFSGTFKTMGFKADGLIRLQKNAANETYMLLALKGPPPMSDSMRARFSASFDSVKTAK